MARPYAAAGRLTTLAPRPKLDLRRFMKRILIASAVVAAVGLVWLVAWLTGPDQAQQWRRDLTRGSTEARRTALRGVAAARDERLLPEVAHLWAGTMRAEGFLRTKYKPGSLQPDIHAVFEAFGRPGAEQLIELADEPGRFVPYLVAAGVALGGAHSAEVGSGAGAAAIRAYRFQIGSTLARIPTGAATDPAARAATLQAWRRIAVTPPR